VKNPVEQKDRHRAMKRSGGIKRFASFVAMLCLLVVSFSSANSSDKYSYDDLNRLVEAVDGNGNANVYVYDPVGNILSVQNSAISNLPPQVATLAPASALTGTTQSVIVTGSNLSGAVLKTDNPGVTVGSVAASASKVTAALHVGYDAKIGDTILTLSTAAGSVSVNFAITSAAPTLTSLIAWALKQIEIPINHQSSKR
jgi:YD repeat-containing protein